MNDMVSREVDAQAFAFELARNKVGMQLPLRELIDTLGMSEERALALLKDPLVLKMMKEYKREMEEKGVSFQLKARIQAEEMLKRNWKLAHDPDTPPAVAAKVIENTVRWAGLEPKTTQNASNSANVPALTINFDLSGVAKSITIDAAPQQLPENDEKED